MTRTGSSRGRRRHRGRGGTPDEHMVGPVDVNGEAPVPPIADATPSSDVDTVRNERRRRRHRGQEQVRPESVQVGPSAEPRPDADYTSGRQGNPAASSPDRRPRPPQEGVERRSPARTGPGRAAGTPPRRNPGGGGAPPESPPSCPPPGHRAGCRGGIQAWYTGFSGHPGDFSEATFRTSRQRRDTRTGMSNADPDTGRHAHCGGCPCSTVCTRLGATFGRGSRLLHGDAPGGPMLEASPGGAHRRNRRKACQSRRRLSDHTD